MGEGREEGRPGPAGRRRFSPRSPKADAHGVPLRLRRWTAHDGPRPPMALDPAQGRPWARGAAAHELQGGHAEVVRTFPTELPGVRVWTEKEEEEGFNSCIGNRSNKSAQPPLLGFSVRTTVHDWYGKPPPSPHNPVARGLCGLDWPKRKGAGRRARPRRRGPLYPTRPATTPSPGSSRPASRPRPPA